MRNRGKGEMAGAALVLAFCTLSFRLPFAGKTDFFAVRNVKCLHDPRFLFLFYYCCCCSV